MTSIQEALSSAKIKLTSITDQPLFEAEILLAHILKKNRSYLHAHCNNLLTPALQEQFIKYIERRLKKEPIAYITGEREFWSLNLCVNAHTLIPRPETECLVESVLNLFNEQNRHLKVADLGTGSGAIALALAKERPHWQLYAVDLSEDALVLAKTNAQRLNLKNILFLKGNWCQPLPHFDFDLIVSNPPYLSENEWSTYGKDLQYEPQMALLSGKNGLEAICEIVSLARKYLQLKGYLFVEHGFLQAQQVYDIFVTAGFKDINSARDLSGYKRITFGHL